MGFLIDTNVIAEIQKGARADPAVAHWFGQAAAEDLFLSVLVTRNVRDVARTGVSLLNPFTGSGAP